MNIIETNQWAIATPTKKGGWRRVPDTRFNDQDSAHAYGKKYHTSKIFGPQYKVIPHPDNLKEESMNEESKMQSFGQFMEDGVGGAGGVGSGIGGLGSVVDKSGNVQSPPVFPAAQKRIVKKGTPMFRRKLDV